MQRSFCFRMYPSKIQQKLLDDQLCICCFLYNFMLDLNFEVYRKHEYSLIFGFQKIIKYLKAYSEDMMLTSVNAGVLQDVCDRVTSAFLDFFRRLKEFNEKIANGEEVERPGFPRFKGKCRYNSLGFSNLAARFLTNDKLQLSKIGPVKIKVHRDIPLGSKLLNVTVRRKSSGKWYVSLCYDISSTAFKKPTKTGKKIGIDLGITNFIMTNEKQPERLGKVTTGRIIKKPNHLRKNIVTICRLQKELARCKKGSKKYQKVKRRLARVCEKTANQRRDFLHKTSRELINNYDRISVENLNVKGMLKHDKVAEKELSPVDKKKARGKRRNISDCSWSAFTGMLVYKAEEAGRRVILVDPKNTTKECSKCHTLVPKTLDQRVHVCPRCLVVLDRDYNASVNVDQRGEALEQGLGTSP